MGSEPWLTNHGDFDRLFIGGDSAGANIAHNIAMRAGIETLPGGIKIEGALLNHPYFWGSEPIGSEPITGREQGLGCWLWKFVYPSSQGGIDDPMINPFAPKAPSLARLGCRRLLVCVAGQDILRDRDIAYCDAVRESGWKGDVELFEADGKGHVFHIHEPENDEAKNMFNCLASFILK
ncbi:hypothetical protein L1049_016674 [Liquidambar formosana]|uniref:Alpha/beta hydrolase fold-3 domain-containing protein n=1 Tax=Liquidambar formosana TaxID=63359 RepID=A0AAP0RZU3_LIQFO